ncbi:MAG: CBS domain-containing protein [bacterium]|nr:CBS domain-containing protein [bacterium]
MDILVLVIGVFGSALSDFLAAALLNMPGSVVVAMAEEGSVTGRRLKRALDEPDETGLALSLLDAIFLVGSTIIASLIALGGADGIRLTALTIGFLIVVVIAKTIAGIIGSRYADRLLKLCGVLLTAARTLATPILLAYTALMKVTRRTSDEEEAREELEALVETAREEGALDAGEYRIMTNIMRLSSIEVGDVMTPRTVVFSLHEDISVNAAIEFQELQMYSRFPVQNAADMDSVSGYVMTKDVLRAALAGQGDAHLNKLKRDVGFIPENITLEKALEQFLAKRQHILTVVDEHGGVEGIITMEDVLETMLGAEIVDEADHVIDLRALAKQRRDQRIQRLSVER